MILAFYRLLMTLAAAPLYALVRVRAMRGREENAHIHERFGIASLPRPSGKMIWVHAASVGEMKSVIPLLQKLLADNADLHCLLTTATVTAAKLVRALKNPRIMHQYAPLDRPAWVERFLDHWQPDAAVWVESEFWPVALQTVKARNLPLMLVNARLSDRSAKRWAMLPKAIASLLGLFDVVLTQTDEIAVRLKSLGAKHAVAAGNMKYATAPLPCDTTALEVVRAQITGRPVLLFASTHDGEEALAIRAHKRLSSDYPNLLSIILPRHPSRGDAVSDFLKKEGVVFARRSYNQTIDASTQIYLADTLGELGLFYRLSLIAYVGNSMHTQPGGGHNPIEPAQLGCAVVYGPSMFNFAQIDRDLRKAHATLQVADEAALTETLGRLLRDNAEIKRLADAAQAFVVAQNGVLNEVLAHLRSGLVRAGISA